MYNSKKAQKEGGAVAVILIVIALAMTLYILFIPPEERQELLQENDTDDTTSSRTSSARIEFLAESPGLLTPTTESAVVHRIPSVNVFLRDEPKIITLAQNLFVSKGLFSESSPKIRFQTEGLDETTQVSLFFSIEKADGELSAKVNGNTFYSEEIESTGVKIIEVPKSLLRENNELEISVSSPGLAFWSKNRYNLKDLGVKQEFERRNNEETRTFTVPAHEKSNLVTAKLKYTQVCNVQLTDSTVAHIDIFINEERAHDAEIRCITTEEEIEIDSDLLVDGTNTITFRLEKGDFSFNLIKLETESRESERPTFFFSLNEDQYNDIQSGERELNLHLLLDQNNQLKNARILINSNEILMQTDRNTFDRDLRDYILEGTNFVKIIPVNSFNLVGLKVVLEE